MSGIIVGYKKVKKKWTEDNRMVN